jgi:yeast amino acid transporter
LDCIRLHRCDHILQGKGLLRRAEPINLICLQGFDTFIPTFAADTFVTAYIGIPVFAIFFAFWKIKNSEHTIPLAEIDLLSGKREIDLEEEKFLEKQAAMGPRTRGQRIWDSL